jgi:hypothetical protein
MAMSPLLSLKSIKLFIVLCVICAFAYWFSVSAVRADMLYFFALIQLITYVNKSDSGAVSVPSSASAHGKPLSALCIYKCIVKYQIFLLFGLPISSASCYIIIKLSVRFLP